MDHNKFRRYVEEVAREFPWVPVKECAKYYRIDPNHRGKRIPLPEAQLLENMKRIIGLEESLLSAKENKIEFRAILSVLSSDYGIEPNDCMAKLQRIGALL